MTWQSYVASMMAAGNCDDAAVIGIDEMVVWASHSGGKFTHITRDEIKKLITSQDREKFYTQGLEIGMEKCSVIRDELFNDDVRTMDLRTKCTSGDGPTFNIAIGKSSKAMVLVKGKQGIHGGTLNKIVFDMANYLRLCQY
ncbi:profilin-2-like [Vanacampus margaritifer]